MRILLPDLGPETPVDAFTYIMVGLLTEAVTREGLRRRFGPDELLNGLIAALEGVAANLAAGKAAYEAAGGDRQLAAIFTGGDPLSTDEITRFMAGEAIFDILLARRASPSDDDPAA